MFQWIRKSIKNKIIFLVMSIIILLGCLTVIVTFFANKSFLTEEEGGVLRGLVTESSFVAEKNISSHLVVLKAMSTHPELASYLKNPSPSQRERITIFLEKQNNSDIFNEVVVLGKNGVAWASTDISLVGKDYSQKELYKKSINKEPSISYTADIQKKEALYYVSAPIQEDNGEVVGVLVGQISNESLFSDIISDEIRSHSKNFMVTDDNGLVLYSSDSARILNSVGALTPPEKEEVASNIANIKDLSITEIGYEEVKNNIKDYRGPADYSLINKIDNKKKTVTMSRVGSLPFFIILENQNSDLTNAALKNTLPIALLSLLAIALSTVYILSFVNIVMKPVDILKKVMRSIGRGHLDQDINIKTTDEFRELGDAIELMTLELKEKEMINKIRTEKIINSKNKKKEK